MRVARTETNMAYRKADNERWGQMDFVLGQRIALSKSHPAEDICDELAGDYPVDFEFTGWHPQCFCVATPILPDEDEMRKATAAAFRGETYTPKGNRVTEYPKAFRDWVTTNKSKIAAARAAGSEPYFLRNNKAAVDGILNPSKKAQTILDKAAARHAARTPEQAAAIQKAWDERKALNKSNLRSLIQSEGMKRIAYKEVKDLSRPLTAEEIIGRIGGGDMTKGSCSSLAFAYAGNRCGYEVYDYRDGESRSMFSQLGVVKEIAKSVGGIVDVAPSDFTSANRILQNVQEGKEYYFTCGKHAAIVRKVSSGLEYLELQSATHNGFKKLNKAELRKRFGAQTSHSLYGMKFSVDGCLIDIELLKADPGFRYLLGRINTDPTQQRKGPNGTIK